MVHLLSHYSIPSLLKFRGLYYALLIIQFYLITYFFCYWIGLVSITAILSVTIMISEIFYSNIKLTPLANENRRMVIQTIFYPILILLLFTTIFSILTLDLYRQNFSVPIENLKQVEGIVISDEENASYVDISPNDHSKTIKLLFNYDYVAMDRQKFTIPKGEAVIAKFIETNKFSYPNKNSHNLLAYDIRSDSHIYLDYATEKAYYLNFQQQGIKRTIISTILYIFSGGISIAIFLFLATNPKSSIPP